MQAFILIGVKQTTSGPVPENIYTGLDGVALQLAADKAAASRSYISLTRLTNPSGSPMPIDPTPTVATVPVFPRPKTIEAAKVAAGPKHLLDAEEASRKLREARLAPSLNTLESPTPVPARPAKKAK